MSEIYISDTFRDILPYVSQSILLAIFSNLKFHFDCKENDGWHTVNELLSQYLEKLNQRHSEV